MFGPRKKLLLLLCNDALHAYTWQQQSLVPEGQFRNDEAGHAAFAALLAAQQGAMCHVLLDVVEEDFAIDTAPHVAGRDRHAMLKRKLETHFRGARYANYWLQGREQEGRRDDRLLLSAISNNARLDPWLDRLDAAAMPLAGVHSLTLLSITLARHHDLSHEPVLIASWQPESGLRQSFYKAGELKFSRLTPIHDASPALLVERIGVEAERTRQYAASLRLIQRGETMQTLVVTADGLDESALSALPATEGVAYQAILLDEVAQHFRTQSHADDAGLAQVLLRALGQHGWRNHYAPPERRRFYRLWQAARGLTIATVAGTVIGLTWAGNEWLNTEAREDDLDAVAPRIRQVQQQALAIQPPASEQAPHVMKATVMAVDSLKARWPDMFARWAMFGRDFQAYPQLALRSLDWSVDGQPSLIRLTEGGATAASPAATPAEGGGDGQPATAAPGDTLYEFLAIGGRVDLNDTRYRQTDYRLRQLADGLATRSRGAVAQLEPPLDARSTSKLDRPDLSQDNAATGAFQVEWKWEAKP